jgi:hypothetical protein
MGQSRIVPTIGLSTGVLLCYVFGLPLIARSQAPSLPPGVERVCSIQFDKDTKRPARVDDSALSCIERAAKKLREKPYLKLVLVGVADVRKDHTADENGHMRETEDTTGLDVRWEDLAAYRSLNTKWYLTRWYESIQGQDVTFYVVPGAADFNHNYLETTKTNENPCTVKPCYSADEESLKAQPRSRIPEPNHAEGGK